MANSLSVLFLNAWGMRYSSEVMSLILQRKPQFDIMCFTEVARPKSPMPKAKIYQEGLAAPVLLDGHSYLAGHLYAHYDHRFDGSDTETWVCARSGDTYYNVDYGSSLFWRRTPQLIVLKTGALPINTGHIHRGVRTLQWLIVQKGSDRYLIAHLHGVWIEGNTKNDSPERLRQSRLVRTELQKLMRQWGCKQLLLGGDLNLALETEAIKRLEGVADEGFLLNLIREFGIESTRTRLYRKHGQGSQHADYAFVSGRVRVQSFAVDTTFAGSDHAPLMLTIS